MLHRENVGFQHGGITYGLHKHGAEIVLLRFHLCMDRVPRCDLLVVHSETRIIYVKQQEKPTPFHGEQYGLSMCGG